MNKKDQSAKNGEERKGFARLGYLEKADYPKRILELTRRQIDIEALDKTVDQNVTDKKGLFFDDAFKECASGKAVYAFIPTGEKGYRQSKEIVGGFYRSTPSQEWKGVYLEYNLDILKEDLSDQRQRSDLEEYTYLYDYSHIARQCRESFPAYRTEEEWANYLGALFSRRKKAGKVFVFPSGSYFKGEEPSKEGELLYFWMERNDKPGAKQKGFGLSIVTEADLLETWGEEQYKNTLDHLSFGNWDDLEDFVEEVGNTAMPENWSRMNTSADELSYGHPVLKAYLEYTLIRLRHLDSRSLGYLLREEGRIYFNTGLLNKFFRQIIIGAHRSELRYDIPGLGERQFEFYFDPYIIVSGHDTKFPTETGLLDFPRIATYFEKKEDVLYDASLEIMLNDEHIFEDGLKAGRIPIFKEEYARVKNDSEGIKNLHIRVQARVQTAIQRARLLAERNYKLAIPQYWKETGEIQFLLPLYMEEAEYTGRPQCALALRRAKNDSYYEGATILSLDMAYSNARLIAKPDVTWLNRGVCTDDFGTLQVSCPVSSVVMNAMKETPYPEAPAPVEEPESVASVDSDEEEDLFFDAPELENIGRTSILTNIVSRPSGKGLRGEIYGATGTIARNLLRHPVPQYTSGKLKVKIVDVNPQGTQYILEPVEE